LVLCRPRSPQTAEPDHELYTPLLRPLIDEEGSTYKLIPKSGAIWGQLNNLLSPANLPEQVEYKAGDPRLDKPNDTLLVLATLAWHPKKPYRAFPSVSLLVIHQLLSAVRAHSLFHRYGLIRMLVWLTDDEGKQVLPRNISARRKMAIEAEVSCANIFEIASSTVESIMWKRDERINVESSRRVLKRMEDAGIKTPEGREGSYQLQATNGLQEEKLEDDRIAVRREWQEELQQLQERFAAGQFSEHVEGDVDRRLPPKPKPKINKMRKPRRVLNPEWTVLRDLRWLFEDKKKKGKEITKGKRLAKLKELEAKFEAGGIKTYLDPDPNVSLLIDDPADGGIAEQTEALPTSKGRPRAKRKTLEFLRMKSLAKRLANNQKQVERAVPLFSEFEAILEMQKKVQTLEGPEAEVLQRDINERTAALNEVIETLSKVDADTFWQRLDNYRTFQNEPSILYWDRREAEPLQVKPDEFYPNHELCLLDFQPTPLWPVLRQDFPATYDVFEYILSSLFITPTQSVKSALTAVSPGALEWLVPECPSLKDISKGGNPDLNLLAVRCLTLEMLKEIMEAWMRWPFRPDRFELMKKSGSTAHDPDEESLE
jgi:hypothetical protein